MTNLDNLQNSSVKGETVLEVLQVFRKSDIVSLLKNSPMIKLDARPFWKKVAEIHFAEHKKGKAWMDKEAMRYRGIVGGSLHYVYEICEELFLQGDSPNFVDRIWKEGLELNQRKHKKHIVNTEAHKMTMDGDIQLSVRTTTGKTKDSAKVRYRSDLDLLEYDILTLRGTVGDYPGVSRGLFTAIIEILQKRHNNNGTKVHIASPRAMLSDGVVDHQLKYLRLSLAHVCTWPSDAQVILLPFLVSAWKIVREGHMDDECHIILFLMNCREGTVSVYDPQHSPQMYPRTGDCQTVADGLNAINFSGKRNWRVGDVLDLMFQGYVMKTNAEGRRMFSKECGTCVIKVVDESARTGVIYNCPRTWTFEEFESYRKSFMEELWVIKDSQGGNDDSLFTIMSAPKNRNTK